MSQRGKSKELPACAPPPLSLVLPPPRAKGPRPRSRQARGKATVELNAGWSRSPRSPRVLERTNEFKRDCLSRPGPGESRCPHGHLGDGASGTRTPIARVRAFPGTSIAEAARHVLDRDASRGDDPRAPIVADRIAHGSRAAASFAEKFALASLPARGGIKHGTVRWRLTPRTRAESTFPHAIDRSFGIVAAGRIEPALLPSLRGAVTVRPFTEACSSSEEHVRLQDQGGPR